MHRICTEMRSHKSIAREFCSVHAAAVTGEPRYTFTNACIKPQPTVKLYPFSTLQAFLSCSMMEFVLSSGMQNPRPHMNMERHYTCAVQQNGRAFTHLQ